MKKFLAIISMITVLFLTGCSANENKVVEKTDNQQQELLNSGENSGDNSIVEIQKLDSKLVEAYINIINSTETENVDGNMRYDLVYFNNDDIPDLVVGNPWYEVSLYLYDNGNVYNPIEKWAYGAMGNHGYDYEEKSGTIVNYNTDFAGAIMKASTLILNSNYEFDILSVTAEGAEISEDDPNYQAVKDYINAYGGYYYNGEKISEEEYMNKVEELTPDITSSISKILCGSKTASEMITELQAK